MHSITAVAYEDEALVSFHVVGWDVKSYRAALKVMRALDCLPGSDRGLRGSWYGTNPQRNWLGYLDGVSVQWIETREMQAHAKAAKAIKVMQLGAPAGQFY